MNKDKLNRMAERAVKAGRVIAWMETAKKQEQDSFADGLWLAAIFAGINPNDLTPDDLIDLFDQAHKLRPRLN